jgi:hypothetical protein
MSSTKWRVAAGGSSIGSGHGVQVSIRAKLRPLSAERFKNGILKGRVPIFRKWDEWPLQSVIVSFDFQLVVRLPLRIRLPIFQLRGSRCDIGR